MTGTSTAGYDRPLRVGTVQDDSFTIPTCCVLPADSIEVGVIEVGVVGKGTAAGELTRRMADDTHQLDTRHRGVRVGFDWWPDQTAQELSSTATTPMDTALVSPHGNPTVTCPTAGCP